MQLFPALPEVVRGMFRRPEALAVCPPGGGPRERGMFLNQTANYRLSQWENTDRILMEDFNTDNSKIDAALTGLDTRAAALEAAAGGFGNCQISVTTYVGDGLASKTLTFDDDPQFLFISGHGGWLAMTAGAQNGKGQDGRDPTSPVLTWGDKSVTFQDSLPQEICNLSGTTYFVVSLFGKAAV